MFYKAVTWEIDDGDAENGPGKSYEEIWAVCRASDKIEARVLLKTFMLFTSGRLIDIEIEKATEDEYLEYLHELEERMI